MEKPRYDVFLSHATLDKPVVEELARILKRRGFEPWLDKWNLVPGEPWQEAIEEALRNSATCAVCLGASGTGPWQNAEMRAAINRRVSGGEDSFRVIPVLLPGAGQVDRSQLSDFLTATTWIEFHETLDDDQALYRLLCGIQGIPPGPGPGMAVAEGARPYRGLQVFDVDDALFFFGREELTARLLEKLQTDRVGTRFLAIVGPSGSGKSFLARAGLLASLKRGKLPESGTWPIAICKPGAEPLQSLALAFGKAFSRGTSEALKLIGDLAANPHALHIATHLSLGDAPADRRLVVLVDQFEEVFTLCADEGQRQALIDNLLYAAKASEGQTVVILSLRADFYGRCAAYPDLAAAMSDQQSLIGPMSRKELRSAIQRPAYLTGCEPEGGLADLLLNEVEANPGSLPLLEHALLEIWQRREGGRRLTVAAYHEIGGVAGALERQAEEVYSGFTEEEKETCRRVFLRLVQVDEQGRATKRRLSLDDLVPTAEGSGNAIKTVVARLTNARLLTTDKEELPTVELAHEALLANWNRLKQWIEQDREALRTRRRLDEAVAEWLGKNRDPSFLLEGGRLAQVEEWATGHSGEIGPDARELLDASIAQRNYELAQARALEEEQRRRADAEHQRAEEQTRAGRRLRKWVIVSGIVAAVAVIAAITALYLRHIAERQRRIAFAGQLSERSRTVSASNPQLGLLLSIQALKVAQDAGEAYLPSVQSALRWALAESGGTPLPSGPVSYVFQTPDRRLLLTIGEDRHLRLWHVQANKPPTSSRDLGEIPKGTMPQLASTLTGDWLLLAGEQGARLIDLRTPVAGLPAATFLSGEDWLFDQEPFSADGRWLLTRGDRGLLLRDLKTPEALSTLLPHTGDVNTFSFSPDSLTLVSASGQGPVEFRDLKTPLHSTPVGGLHEKTIERLVFQNNQTLIVTTRSFTSPFIDTWSISRNGKVAGPTQLKGCYGDRLAIHSQGTLSLLCVAERNTTGIWSAKPNFTSNRERDWPFWVSTIDFSPDGRRHAVGDLEGNIYLQSTSESANPPYPPPVQEAPVHLPTQAAPVRSVIFPIADRWLVTHGGIEAPRLWDIGSGLDTVGIEPRLFRVHEALPIVTAKGEVLRLDPTSGQWRFWNLDGGYSTLGLSGTDGPLFPLEVRSDGRWVAAADKKKRTLLLWRINPDGSVEPPIYLSKDHDFRNLTFSPGGNWLAAIDSESALLWNLHNPKAPPHSLTNSSSVLAFSPNDDLIASIGTSENIRLRVLSKEGPRQADSPNPPLPLVLPRALAFSPDGEWLVMGGKSDRIQAWKAPGRNIFLENRGTAVTSLAFSPDGRWLAAGGQNGTIQLWRWASEKTVPQPILLEGHTRAISSLVFTSRGLLSASWDGTLRGWELRTDTLTLGCRGAGRTLSKKEWSTYLPFEPYQEDEPCPGLPKAPDQSR